jgi:hypothetical protein
MNFFPNGFKLDAYYSVPRIFRYLAPLSFPIALHAAKCVLDLTRLPIAGAPSAALATGLVAPLLALYVAQAVQANGPSAIYHRTLHAVLDDVQRMRPPALIAEAVLASYFRDLYLDPDETQTRVTILHTEHSAVEYESWLRSHEAELPDGTFLITGLASFIHYGAHIDGFRLQWFKEPLPPEWKLVREYETLTYLPRPEPARIWRLEKHEAPRVVQHDEREDLSTLRGIDDPAALLRGGMARYDKGDNAGARVWFKKLSMTNDPEAENGAFFYAAATFRQGDCIRAQHEFKRLIHRFPHGRWVPSAYWHLATCEKSLGRMARSRELFASIVRRFPKDPATVAMAKRDLQTFERRREGVIAKWWHGA